MRISDWSSDVCSSDLILALLERAPLDLRVNALKGTQEEALAALTEAVPTCLSPMGLRLPDGFQVEATDAWRAGLVEIQDEGSQLLAIACDARAGMTGVDLCAGAGGKTMELGAETGNSGRLLARATTRPRLSGM